MKSLSAVLLIGLLSVLGIGGCTIGTVVSTLNSEAFMKNGIKAQEDNREQAFDKLYKKIAQSVQVTKASSEQQLALVEELIKGRPAGFVRVVQEANPDSAFSREQFGRLQTIIEAERDFFFREQKVLISKVEQYNNQFDGVVSGTVLNMFGRQRYPNPIIITGDSAKNARETGKDNNVDLEL